MITHDTDQYGIDWRTQLLRGGCLLIGVGATLAAIMLYIHTGIVETKVISYLSFIVILCGFIFYLCKNSTYIFVSATVLSTIIFICTTFLPQPRELIDGATGVALIIPACLMGMTTGFRFGLIFSFLDVLTLIVLSFISGVPWTSNTIVNVLILIIVMSLLFLMNRLLTTLEQRNESLRTLASQAEELATMRERTRIARDFHDSLGAHLSGLTTNLRAAKALLRHDLDSAEEAVIESQAIVKEAATDVRLMIDVLRNAPIASQPLLDLITRLIERNKAAGIVTDLHIVGSPYELASSVNDTLYRTVQEGLTNIRKHAHATRATVQVDYGDPKRVYMRIQDNGQGTDQLEGGFGLIGIQERVAQLNGTFQITTAPNQGLRLEVEVPV